MAMVIRGVLALPAEAPSALLSSDCLPPELLEQPAASRVPARTVAVRMAARWFLCMSLAPRCACRGGVCGERERVRRPKRDHRVVTRCASGVHAPCGAARLLWQS